MEGVAAKFEGSKSDRSQQKTFTTENAFDFVGSTAIQLFQQQNIAKYSQKLVSALGSNNKDIAKNLSLGYMALTSCDGVYETFKEAGASDAVAGLAVLGNVAALYSLLDSDYYKD